MSMLSAIATAAASAIVEGLPTDYYAPDYRILVNGQELHPDTKGDVLEVKVTMDIDNLTSFELTINNWDDEHIDFKYSDLDTFDVGTSIEVFMGYAGKVLSMVKGQVSGLSPRFPESGTPTLGVSGLDAMFRLKDRKPGPNDRKSFTNMADWEIAQVIAARNGLQSKVTRVGQKYDLVVQKNQDDALFLMERAKRIDFDCFIANDSVTGLDTLNFTQPTDSRAGGQAKYYEFEWGRSLISFSPTLTLSKQVGQITVRGWDPRTKEAIVATAKPEDLPGGGGDGGKGKSGPSAVADSFPNKQDVVVDAPVTSLQEARDLAVSLLRERSYEFITGSGQVIGVPDLRPGTNVRLSGLGQRFTSDYYVKQVVHTLGGSGYFTQFEVRSAFDGGTRSS
jgi:phage protein D